MNIQGVEAPGFTHAEVSKCGTAGQYRSFSRIFRDLGSANLDRNRASFRIFAKTDINYVKLTLPGSD